MIIRLMDKSNYFQIGILATKYLVHFLFIHVVSQVSPTASRLILTLHPCIPLMFTAWRQWPNPSQKQKD